MTTLGRGRGVGDTVAALESKGWNVCGRRKGLAEREKTM